MNATIHAVSSKITPKIRFDTFLLKLGKKLVGFDTLFIKNKQRLNSF